MDIQHCQASAKLYGISDNVTYDTRPKLHKWDVDTGQCTGSVCEFMEQWDLTCFCITDQQHAGNEAVGGAANTGEKLASLHGAHSCRRSLLNVEQNMTSLHVHAPAVT